MHVEEIGSAELPKGISISYEYPLFLLENGTKKIPNRRLE
jgi:hypothetical protein